MHVHTVYIHALQDTGSEYIECQHTRAKMYCIYTPVVLLMLHQIFVYTYVHSSTFSSPPSPPFLPFPPTLPPLQSSHQVQWEGGKVSKLSHCGAVQPPHFT